MVAQNREKSEEDGHLHKHGQTTRQGVELVLSIKLGHLSIEALGVISILRLQLLKQGSDHLHLGHGLLLLEGQRQKQKTNDDRKDDDGETPVTQETLKALDAVEEEGDQPIPHRSSVSKIMSTDVDVPLPNRSA